MVVRGDNMINITNGLTFDDVLLAPKFSKIQTRKAIDLSVDLSKNISFKHPIIPANMKTVTELDMAKITHSMGGMAILHRFMSWEEQVKMLIEVKNLPDGVFYIGFSVGVKEEDYKKVDYFAENKVRILCIDIAHGDSEQCVAMTTYIAEKYPHIFLIAGNIATGTGAERLWKAGADCVKVGIGPGSLCTTRIETGNGVPQLTALSDVYDMRQQLTTPTQSFQQPAWDDPDVSFGHMVQNAPEITKPIFIIADGGIKAAGDIVKALCFADMIMAGNLFAGTKETPGTVLNVSGERSTKHYKRYEGSSTHKTNHIEGVSAVVPYKGPVKDVMIKLCEGVSSGLSYQGCNNLKSLRSDPQFIRITNAGLKESHPHDVTVA